MDIYRFKKLPIMGIIRGIEPWAIDALIETIFVSGLETIEITMNTPDAAKSIKNAVALSQGRLMIGAGTVLSLDSMHMALDAGASFIVMPTFIKEVAAYCAKNNILFFPGALTPQEVYTAYSSGAAMVKVFPAGLFGPKYFKELKGPFDKIALLAVGGVKLDNIKEYFDCKADGVAVGASVFNVEKIHSGNTQSIKDSLVAIVQAVRKSVS
ncbi:MAG: bifunctional 4-hydroxy-2-oxoglutarate aldolase/2-dehydro-3-deoxy-phosphogluconate aldolase [Candidatus Omnitrophica bacterium]|nr:bifunctional 4-hydroxy-2-oxoglutarate aldolase/2-dehydro-3-deoxy-phosphogluconate aldolase [Candidatus Omnitrophota bacterium]